MRHALGIVGVACALVLGLGCSVGAPVDALRFVCADDQGCADGWVCWQGVCARPEEAVPDTLPGDAEDAGVDASVPTKCPADGPTEAAESTCGDGVDNDCDGAVDCADPDCAEQRCGTIASAVCCGGYCVDTSTSATNCGACGFTCKGSQPCFPVMGVEGTAVSGQCGCHNPAQCPGGQAEQSCSADICSCTTDAACAPGQHCTALDGMASGYCIYPQ